MDDDITHGVGGAEPPDGDKAANVTEMLAAAQRSQDTIRLTDGGQVIPSFLSSLAAAAGQSGMPGFYAETMDVKVTVKIFVQPSVNKSHHTHKHKKKTDRSIHIAQYFDQLPGLIEQTRAAQARWSLQPDQIAKLEQMLSDADKATKTPKSATKVVKRVGRVVGFLEGVGESIVGAALIAAWNAVWLKINNLI